MGVYDDDPEDCEDCEQLEGIGLHIEHLRLGGRLSAGEVHNFKVHEESVRRWVELGAYIDKKFPLK